MPQYEVRDPREAVERHVRAFFDGHRVEERRWELGPIRERVPSFGVLAAAPGPRIRAWTFVSIGCWAAVHNGGGHGLEFVLSARDSGDRHVELLAMTAYYHAGPPGQRLDIGHTVPIGQGWVDGSTCDHLLVTLPYAYGPDLERCAWAGGHARLLALIPITDAERRLKAAEGLEALESRLDDAAADFTNPFRPSVV